MDIIGLNAQAFLRDKYANQDLVKLVNEKQVCFYMKQGVYPLWNELGYNDRILFVFLKEPTLRLFKEWRDQDNEWKNRKIDGTWNQSND